MTCLHIFLYLIRFVEQQRDQRQESSNFESDFHSVDDLPIDCTHCSSENICNSVGCRAPGTDKYKSKLFVCVRRASVCNPSVASHVFGRRDFHSSQHITACCSTDLCNSKGNFTTSYIMSTTKHSVTDVPSTTTATSTTKTTTTLPTALTTANIKSTQDLSNEFWLMFLHMDYNTLEKNETKRESYRHIYILVASEKEGWLVIQSPALKETLNKTINRGKTVIELPKMLKSTNITGVENKGNPCKSLCTRVCIWIQRGIE
ncbi:unnamed protein product [Mytilus edulis]|uniref:UPAR/Ly6 domain-containing protein n=1 Tax=Mytilus edulis TaxID=6550 RepID=A0A8S3Q099_MYTED|nr:unnamed protein product [Mytilus edulis]